MRVECTAGALSLLVGLGVGIALDQPDLMCQCNMSGKTQTGRRDPPHVSMETRTGTFRHTGAVDGPSQGKGKTFLLLLARRFHTP